MALSPSSWNFAIILILSAASTTPNFKASRTSRTRYSKDLSRRASRISIVGRPPQPIHYRSAESLIRNWFCSDKIDIERPRAGPDPDEAWWSNPNSRSV